MMFGLSTAVCFVVSWSLATAHTIITYPGWRGDNLHTSGSITAEGIGVGFENGTYTFPYGQQWQYPCGGVPSTPNNRTLWPVKGGAVAFQPGWFQGHLTAEIHVNLGLGTVPPNMSHVMVPGFQINGPTNDPYNGTICLPQVPLPANISVKVGDNATIQVIENAQHGAGIYNCVDITFADPKDVAEVNETNCFNSSDITFAQIFSTTSLSGAQSHVHISSTYLAFIPIIATTLVLAFS